MPLRIAVLVSFEAAAFLGTLFRPWWGILMLLVLIFARPQDDRPNMAQLHIPMVLATAAVLATGARLTDMRKKIWESLKQNRVLIVYFLLMCLSAAFNGLTEESSNRIDQFSTATVLCVLLLIWTQSTTNLIQAIGVVIASGLYLLKLAVFNPSFIKPKIGGEAGEEFNRLSLQKLNTNFGNSNYLALFMVLLILLTLFVLLHYRSVLVRLACAALCGGWLWVFFRAQSRAATLALAASLVAFWLFQKHKMLLALALPPLLIVGLVLAPATYFERLQTIENYEQDESATARLGYWQTGLQLMMQNPVLGVGPDNFTRYADNTPHNAYIQVASELGVPSLVLYVTMLVSGFRSAWKTRKLSSASQKNLPMLFELSGALFCGCLAITLQGFFTGLAHREFVFLFLVLCHAAWLTAQAAPRVIHLPARLRHSATAAVVAR